MQYGVEDTDDSISIDKQRVLLKLEISRNTGISVKSSNKLHHWFVSNNLGILTILVIVFVKVPI